MTAPSQSPAFAELAGKPALRAAALARRDAMSGAERDLAARAIAGNAAPLVARIRPMALAGYFPIRSEADPRPILALAEELGADLALPALEGDGLMVFRAWRQGDGLSRAAVGFLQPGLDKRRLDPDALLVPLAAFDRSGHRIGYGKGHYDRALATRHAAPPLLIGIAFACQEVAAIPIEPHDIRLDWIVTEREVLAFGDDGEDG